MNTTFASSFPRGFSLFESYIGTSEENSQWPQCKCFSAFSTFAGAHSALEGDYFATEQEVASLNVVLKC